MQSQSLNLSALSKDGHLKHFLGFAVVLGFVFYFLPILTIALLVCGAVDISRHRRISLALIEEYFTAKGLVTWLLSPVNLLADLFSSRGPAVLPLASLPPAHRAEIEACLAAFTENGERIKAHMRPKLEGSKRGMLSFRWFGQRQRPEISIPGFERDYRYIKTIAVSAFSRREHTSWHFGPQRLTLRVLYNLEPVESREVFIAVDDRVHHWVDGQLFIFDDTMFHRSVNNVDSLRYCLFMDIVRPNRFPAAFDAAVVLMSLIAGIFKTIFYKNWSFMR